MDINNLLLRPKHVTVVTGRMLDQSGCPYCGEKQGNSTLAFSQHELSDALQACGNVYIHVCAGCGKRSIGVQNMPHDSILGDLKSKVARQYGGIADDRLIIVSMARNLFDKKGRLVANTETWSM